MVSFGQLRRNSFHFPHATSILFKYIRFCQDSVSSLSYFIDSTVCTYKKKIICYDEFEYVWHWVQSFRRSFPNISHIIRQIREKKSHQILTINFFRIKSESYNMLPFIIYEQMENKTLSNSMIIHIYGWSHILQSYNIHVDASNGNIIHFHTYVRYNIDTESRFITHISMPPLNIRAIYNLYKSQGCDNVKITDFD